MAFLMWSSTGNSCFRRAMWGDFPNRERSRNSFRVNSVENAARGARRLFSEQDDLSDPVKSWSVRYAEISA